MRLGAGAFCNVYKGAIEGSAPVSKVNPSITAYNTFRDCMCAVKMLPSSADSTAHSDFLQEINFMKSLKHHPYLVSMLGISMDNYGNLMLLIEYCDLGDLLHLIRNKKEEIITNHSNEHTKLRITDMILFAWQISNGLEYLSSIGCVHRDVAARNVFVTSNSICKLNIFIAFRWSYGVLLYELFSFGEIPYTLFQASDILEFLDSGGRLSQPDHCPNEIYRIMLQCWQHEPKLRPMFTEICANLKAIDKFSLKQNMRSEILNEQSNDQI
ncbi:unnamed protein product [Thelazia callipaeda]|uniref:Protein kinase domain-containing protein n=1 Tax=Thelazia callipaeda TaxID=103827 RepID=A0A0N5D3Z2_THECL|nr:unnamed protein product [Thelazia callipaeda]